MKFFLILINVKRPEVRDLKSRELISSNSRTTRNNFFKTQKEINAQTVNRSIEKNIINRLYDNERNKFISKNRYKILL